MSVRLWLLFDVLAPLETNPRIVSLTHAFETENLGQR
jgi:hypothetical protein